MSFLIEIVQSVFRPSFVALSVSLAVAIITLDTDSHTVSAGTVDLTNLGCNGALRTICSAVLH